MEKQEILKKTENFTNKNIKKLTNRKKGNKRFLQPSTSKWRYRTDNLPLKP